MGAIPDRTNGHKSHDWASVEKGFPRGSKTETCVLSSFRVLYILNKEGNISENLIFNQHLHF